MSKRITVALTSLGVALVAAFAAFGTPASAVVCGIPKCVVVPLPTATPTASITPTPIP